MIVKIMILILRDNIIISTQKSRYLMLCLLIMLLLFLYLIPNIITFYHTHPRHFNIAAVTIFMKKRHHINLPSL